MKKANKNMKNKILIFAATIAFVAVATTTFAMTNVSLSPVSVSVNEGQIFNLTVSVNSQVVKSYMVKLEIKFPADVLEVGSFNFGNNWVQLSQPGYDLINNTNGVLIKTAGYPGGLISQADFGTIIFKAKKNGVGAVQITGNSIAFNAENLNVVSGLPVTASVTITQTQAIPPGLAPQTQQGAVVNPTTQNPASTPLANEQPVNVAPEQPAEQPTTQTAAPANTSLIATIGGFMTLRTGSGWVGVLVAVIILAIAVFAIYYFPFKRKRNK